MLGLGASLSLQAVEEPYKELSELNNYADLDIHFDFSVLPDAHATEIAAVDNLGQTDSTNAITSNAGTPLLDRTTMGLPSIAFDGSDEILNMAAAYTTTNKAFTFFIVLQRGDTTNDYTIASATATDTDVPDDYIRLTGAGADVVIALQNQTEETVNCDDTTGSTTNYTANPDINMLYIIRRIASGSVFIYADFGIFIATKASAAAQAGATFELGRIGGTAEGTLADMTGNIGEIGVYDVALSPSDTVVLAEELAKKWGITRDS